MSVCAECGASYDVPGDGCQQRFDALLALDHSRREPWGSRHGLAFAAFALQHPSLFSAAVLDASWAMLNVVYVQGVAMAEVVRRLRSSRAPGGKDRVPPRRAKPQAFAITIADLGPFDAVTYAERLDGWCLAGLAAWRPSR